MIAALPALMTAEEFLARPEPVDGSKEELVGGVIETMPPPQAEHGLLQVQIAAMLHSFVRANRLGWVVTESGTITRTDPDFVRGPDVSFYTVEDYPERPAGYFRLPPALAVEILSPDDRPSRVRRKVNEYLDAGVRLVWVVEPDSHSVMVYRPGERGIEYAETDTLDGADVLPGFTCPVADLFN